MNTWYTSTKPDDPQGLVIDEATGENIAVTYDPRHAPLVAAAPELLETAKELIEAIYKARTIAVPAGQDHDNYYNMSDFGLQFDALLNIINDIEPGDILEDLIEALHQLAHLLAHLNNTAPTEPAKGDYLQLLDAQGRPMPHRAQPRFGSAGRSPERRKHHLSD